MAKVRPMRFAAQQASPANLIGPGHVRRTNSYRSR